MKQSLRTGGKQTEQLLENLCKILHFQHEADKSTSPSSQDQLKIVSKFSRVIDEVVPDLLPLLVRTKLIPKVLKILYFLQFQFFFFFVLHIVFLIHLLFTIH